MSECSYMPPQVCLVPLATQGGGIVPQTPSSHYKPPNEAMLSPSGSVLEEEKETASPLHVLFPCLQRLESSNEELVESRSLPAGGSSSIGVSRDDSAAPPSPIFGNSLGSQGNSSDSVSQLLPVPAYSNVNVRDCLRSESRTGSQPVVISSVVSNSSNCSSSSSNNKSRNQLDANVSSATGGGCLSPAAVTTSNAGVPAFPSEPTILADKYILLGPVDASTSHAVHVNTHEPVHVKAVSPHTAREVCSQQALLERCEGVRAPLEAVLSGCGKRAWLIFPPHYGDLHSYVRLRRRLREAEAQRLFAQVASTVDRCHASGLVLRDLKLRKFVFTDSNRQKVVLESVEDSVVAGESDLLHDKHGCPAYVAPEILSASTYSGRYADMWGLGVILYTMLVGRYPFHNADTSTLFARIRSGKFSIPEWVSSRARHLILSLLRRQPHRRLNARKVLLHPWLNRSPRDHVGKDPQDHIVPASELMTQHTLSPGKSRPP